MGSPLLSLIQSSEDPPQTLGSRKLNPKWIDMELPMQWKRTCEQSHGKKCSRYCDTLPFHSIRPKLLIDTEDQCLVDMNPSLSYVALSYVWEQVDSLKTSLPNLSQLRHPRALAPQPGFLGVTPAIRNAMHVVKLLGERYLWADALCIVQDDEKFKHAEIQNMHAIYANASFTIVAASSFSCGIAGIANVTEARQLNQTVHRFGAREVAEISRDRDVPGSTSRPSRWDSRGWTFQEGLFSPRKLIFAKDTVRWECFNATWKEDQATLDKERSVPADPMSKIFLRQIPDVNGLVALLNSYSARSLTHEEDILFACAGMFSALRPSYSDGFISGLPVAFFNSALLWVHYGPAKRRKSKIAKNSNICLPSWSWAGWQGEFSLANWRVGVDHEINSSYYLGDREPSFNSHIQWYSHESRDSEPKAIFCSWSHNRDTYFDSERNSPPNRWNRIRGPSHYSSMDNKGPNLALLAHPKWYYTHESDPNSYFRYPVNTQSAEDKTPTNIPIPFISCQTRRSFAFCGPLERCQVRDLEDKFRNFGGQTTYHLYTKNVSFCSLFNEYNGWIGALQVHENLTLDDAENSRSHHLFDNRLELVEIGEGSYTEGSALGHHNVPEYNLEERRNKGEWYEFYYVLWIEWESGVAYRRGLGRVEREAWEKQDLEDIHLMLG